MMNKSANNYNKINKFLKRLLKVEKGVFLKHFAIQGLFASIIALILSNFLEVLQNYLLLIIFILIISLFYLLKIKNKRKKLEKTIFKVMLPDILKDVFSDYKPQMMKKPDQSFFKTSFNHPGVTDEVTYGILNYSDSLGIFKMYPYFSISEIIESNNDDERWKCYVPHQAMLLNVKLNKDNNSDLHIILEHELLFNNEPLNFQQQVDQLMKELPNQTNSQLVINDFNNHIFNSSFVVRSNDKSKAYDFFTEDRMIKFLNFHKKYGAFSFEFSGMDIKMFLDEYKMIGNVEFGDRGVPLKISEENLVAAKKELDEVIKDIALIMQD